MFTVGGRTLRIMQAGLAGYSDRAMRLVARRRGCPYAVTEALLDVILLQGGQGLKNSIDIDDRDHPVAGQIIGADGDTMAAAAKILHDAGYDTIDLNFACPVKKIKNKSRGGAMLQEVDRALDVLAAVRDALPPERPTTVSLRRAYDDSTESVDRFFAIVERAWSLGYAAVRVHGRTVEQKYAGRADWGWLKRIKETYPNQVIVGSGDLFTAGDVVRMLDETGVDAAWIGRGAIGNPWIFNHVNRLLAGEEGESILPPTLFEQRAALQEHFDEAMQIHGESLAGRRMRKMGIKYSRFHLRATDVKAEFIAVHSLRDWNAVLDRWYTDEAPGVWPPANAVDEVNGGFVGSGL